LMQKGMNVALTPYFELTNVSISSLCPPSFPALDYFYVCSLGCTNWGPGVV
jgi:hypothetical protein